ncbi:hypothetical protein [Shewanella sp. CG12_big_fil_rev_8_21_14_0_65_47_15]|uniref:hypothetical protein n=1 Tax=Shewanella sp. CG12_big_fil_rev_8_21_14_0_65_47_15 TaxID=1975537 RepID=UPI000CBBE12B|nr:hypothetical protein [Shewanella sp. CG12_big_fil_rev_8_21_14_0_65_47_15]PIW60817.1 MAG: hypothetical protein COW15_11215 [Shewanella sp. CG12_big_fil_rev_8_21_14_0_65_47_15]
MKNRKALSSKNGLSLVQVDHLDGNGDVIRVSYEVCDANGNVLGEFSSIGDAEEFIKNYRPEPPRPTFKM